MSGTNFFRLIETYFEGSIQPHEKVLLEQQILKDPLLKAEFDLQQNIVSGIKQNRRTQLKQRLSAIETPSVSTTVGYLGAAKWLAATITAATIFGGLLYWFTGNNNPIIPLDLKSEDVIIFENTSNLALLSAPEPATPFEVEESELITASQNKVAVKTLPTQQTEEIIKAVEVNQKADIIQDAEVKPQSLLSFEDEKLFEGSNIDHLKTLSPIAVELKSKQNSEIEIKHAKIENKYHYQYLDNKLYLYGNFDEEPYEIIELKNLGNKKLYLSYKKAIYLIDTDVKEISELQKITDPKLKQDLFLIIDSK